MGSVLYKVLDWCRWLFGVVPRSAIGSPRSFLIIHYVFIALIAVGLYFANDWIVEHVPFLPREPEHLEWAKKIWCSILFLLMYGIIRTVLFLLAVLGIEEESDFPDIEADWKEILTALERERIYIDELPLFLVNGLTPQQEVSAFDAAFDTGGESEWRVISPPVTRTSAVIRVFARDSGIYLCMSGVGVTSCQQGKVATEIETPSSRSGRGGGETATATGTVRAGQLTEATAKARSATGTMQSAPPVVETPPPHASTPISRTFLGTMMPGGLKRAMQTFAAANQNAGKGYGKKRVLPVNEVESLVGVRRVRFLCSLISKVRSPFCGINGMLQAIPLSWATDADNARKLAPAIRDDLVAVHSALQLQFPVVAMVTELDDVSGVREFLLRSERLHPGLRMSRAGSSFAAGADVSESNAEWVVDAGLRWFRGWVYNAFSYDIDNRDNSRLFQMICELGQRRDSLVILLRQSLYRIVRPNIRLHGVYFLATGRSSTEQGFIRGVLDKLPDSQNEVAWSPQFVKNMQRSRMITVGLFLVSALAAVGTLILLWKKIAPQIN
ncbi:MAG: hypothetical protein JNL58_10020 [Planctomyces sp.]|nr:hypothetical protein [Planctomyces sp.]